MTKALGDKPQQPFKINDKVFQSDYRQREHWITCPDCLGSRHVKVTLGDGTELQIECGGCNPGGYEPPKGAIRQYEYSVETKERTVTGVCMHGSEVSYELDRFGNGCSYYTAKAGEVFSTCEEALAYGMQQKDEHESAENKRWLAKTKDHRSWAWNATYHRQCAKRARKEAEYHEGKAKVCAIKAKEPA